MPAPWARGAKCRIIGQLHGQQTVNVIHFATNEIVSDGPDFEQLLLQLATAVKECVVEMLLPGVTNEWQFLRTEAQAIYPDVSDPVIASGVPTDVGELGPVSASFISSLVHLRTGGGGRRGRGRIFLPPPGEPQSAASEIDAPTLVLLAAFLACLAEKFFEGQATTFWRIGVLSRANLGGIVGSFDNSFRQVTQMTPSQVLAKMGSRKKGVGA